jgi:undecaprenyl-diphosphatase
LVTSATAREALRVVRDRTAVGNTVGGLGAATGPSLIGLVGACVAGLLALKWLSRWLETGRWYIFGIYCVIAAIAVYALHARGF